MQQVAPSNIQNYEKRGRNTKGQNMLNHLNNDP